MRSRAVFLMDSFEATSSEPDCVTYPPVISLSHHQDHMPIRGQTTVRSSQTTFRILSFGCQACANDVILQRQSNKVG
jgi:hypothetical protein